MKIFNKLTGLFLLIGIFGCKNDLEINAPYQDIPVVYGFLDQNQPIQYIRIQKVYQNSSNSNTSEGARINDSLYFDSLVVDLIDNTSGISYSCKAVDTLLKDSGLFSYSRHRLYATVIPKNNAADERFTLRIFIPSSGKTFFTKEPIAVVKDAQIESRTISIDTTASSRFPFRYFSGKNAVVYDLSVKLKYREMNANDTTQFVNKEYEFFVQRSRAPLFLDGREINTEWVTSRNYINTLKSAIPANNAVRRRIIGIEYAAYGGAKEFQEYLELSKPNTSIVPKNSEYTNIVGGRGIFTSRNLVISNQVFLDGRSVRVLSGQLPNFIN